MFASAIVKKKQLMQSQKRLNVLVGCEYSGIVRDAFIARGHRAMSCDFLPTESKGPHYQGDLRDVLDEPWDLAIFHPTCTYAANSGVRFLHEPDQSELPLKGKPRWEAVWDAAQFFKLLLASDIPKICVENPVPHGYFAGLIRTKYTQIIQPFHHGHLESKATALWLKKLPKLLPTNDVKEAMDKLPKKDTHVVHYTGSGKGRAKARSLFYTGGRGCDG